MTINDITYQIRGAELQITFNGCVSEAVRKGLRKQ